MRFDPAAIADLLYWVRERESMRIRKEEQGLPRPWTKDPILATYRFCNVRRSDDRVTRWINDNISRPFANDRYLWWGLCAARMINWPPTLKELIDQKAWPTGDHFDPEALLSVLLSREQRGEKVYTGAYKIPAPRSGSKSPWIARGVLGALWTDRNTFDQRAPTVQSTVNWLRGHDGWGPFLSYQAVIDMRFTRLLSGAPDVSTFAAAGPGTIRGLNRMAGRPVAFELRQRSALREMREVFALVRAELPKIEIDFSDVGNLMCELDKYLRIKNREGQMKNRYSPSPPFEATARQRRE